ncbi:MAG: transposase [Chitinophagales bacterium]
MDKIYRLKRLTIPFQAVKRFVKQFKQEQDGIVLAMENTGRYNVHLYEVLEHLTWSVYVVSPLHIKKSIGLVRGKDDKTDAQRITSLLKTTKNCPYGKPIRRH